MNRKIACSLMLLATLSFAPAMAKDKVWTIDARQSQLMKDINTAQKSKQLTDKEAESLRADLADVSRKKAKMKTKNTEKDFSSDQKNELEGDLNKISVKIQKLQLEKRISK